VSWGIIRLRPESAGVGHQGIVTQRICTPAQARDQPECKRCVNFILRVEALVNVRDLDDPDPKAQTDKKQSVAVRPRKDFA
jgi:hypothetical protein